MAEERLQPRGDRAADIRALYLGHAALTAFASKVHPDPHKYFPHLAGNEEMSDEEMLRLCQMMAGG